ncbi:DNA polymerase III subunit epsilon [Aquitalea sp. S1-19]|uniref:DNA polymerase III subunit epsilon n=1 Tax=Craterilacuibacter sinensis TaxID=2686017 RepID=A0A845BS50_9NEIS|nr:DNA polymerase III subunit epsilon [Craterilacuibacter sinensis]MCP9760647.1 DNA polymerase III subunit epsilon [Aquitalea sp. S1-19]MXR37978.1 DNA polymerase III subunit epsilon [Craterilacuibacter sinensis]RQW26553.1 DNA polymerase III subunit epsilon [Rhodobacteraceae bacterium CH30]
MRQIILDTETTGLEPSQGHRIIEFAALEMVDRKLTGRHLHLYMHPERAIDPDAQRVHGISLEFLEGKPRFADVAAEISDFIADGELIIHNAPFDIGFMNAEFERAGLPMTAMQCAGVIDTLVMARDQFPGKRNSLDALCDRFDVDRSNRTVHGALIDCELLAEVYLWMTRGQESLAMDVEQEENGLETLELLNYERKPIPVLRASEDELAEHAQYLDALDKSVKGVCVWRQLEAGGQA